MKGVRDHLLSFWICLSAAYIALLPQFYQVLDAENRYWMLWSHAYHWAILGAILLLALMFFGARFVLRHVGCRCGLARWTDAFCMLWLIFVGGRTLFALAVLQVGLPPVVMRLLWSPWVKAVVYVALPLPLVVLRPAPARTGLKKLYAVLSVLLVYFVAASFVWMKFERYNVELGEAAARSKVSDGRNFIVFIMDEWSYGRTFGQEGWPERLPGLAELLEESTLYTQAYSLGGETPLAVSRLLYSNDEAFMRYSYMETIDFFYSYRPYPGASIFNVAPADWLRFVVGASIHYPVLLQGRTDIALNLEGENTRRTFRGELRRLLRSQFAFLRIAGVKFRKEVDPEGFPQLEIHEYAMDLISTHDMNSFGIFHYYWPHFPYFWDRQGRREGVSLQEAQRHTVPNYQGNLEYMDVILAEICARLREYDKWENSLIVFTGDHEWRWDPALPDYFRTEVKSDVNSPWKREDENPTSPFKHVPLIIKYPGQREGAVEDSVVSHQGLYRLLDAYVRGEDLSNAVELLRMTRETAGVAKRDGPAQ